MLNLKAGKETQLLQHNMPRRVFCFLCFTVFCHFLRLHRLHCSTVANFASPFHLSLSLSGVKAGNPEQAGWAHTILSPTVCFQVLSLTKDADSGAKYLCLRFLFINYVF